MKWQIPNTPTGIDLNFSNTHNVGFWIKYVNQI